MWRGGGRLAYRFPPLSSGGASLAQPWLRFHIPLIEPDRRISRIRLSDKISRLCLTRDAICGSRTRCGVYRLPNLPAPSLHRRYPASAVLRTSPPPQGARPVPRGLPVGRCSDRAMGLPVLRSLSLCTCCRHYPGAAAGYFFAHSPPAVSAFPERVVGSACASSFSRLARRSLALRPAHSRCHQFVTRFPKASAISSPP